jgi:2-methoxy-6-polyprenyl-1,4-benzoquinol methylase
LGSTPLCHSSLTHPPTHSSLYTQYQVRGVFSSVADNYDVMNDLMSGGVHRLWKDDFVKKLGISTMLSMSRRSGSDSPPLRFLDVAGGTGDIAFRIIDGLGPAMREPRGEAPAGDGELNSFSSSSTSSSSSSSSGSSTSTASTSAPSVVISDINPEMLRVGKARAEERYPSAVMGGVDFVEANAEELPFDDDSFDVYTIAFGLRNVTHTAKALEEARRVLKPGGRFMCLEFSTVPPSMGPLGQIYDTWSFNAIPLIGQVVTGDRDSYQYLVESIRLFPDQEKLQGMMDDAGFTHTSYTNYTGGIAAVHSGFK